MIIPGVIAGLGTALIAKLSFPGLRREDMLAIAFYWLISLVIGAFIFSFAYWLFFEIYDAVTKNGITESSEMLLSSIPLAAAGSLAVAIGAKLTFARLTQFQDTQIFDNS
jgi:hypothetical protein